MAFLSSCLLASLLKLPIVNVGTRSISVQWYRAELVSEDLTANMRFTVELKKSALSPTRFCVKDTVHN